MPLTRKSLIDAVKKAIELGRGRNFKQSVELIVVFKGVDRKSPEIKFRDAVYLPNGLGKESKILVVADGDMLLKAKEAGVETLSADDVKALSKRAIKKLARTYDWVLVKADLMATVGRLLGPALGPRGKAPIPVPLSADIRVLIKRYRNTTRLRNKEQVWVGCRVGTEDMREEEIVDNIMAVIEHIKTKFKKPFETSTRVFIKTTMGPPIEVSM
ncbi:MAG: 50S ribosomal protein L1 [Desulfurococcales archaeon]|nr:50S ribosomal protein L1 [Desulfurococcales archaeon]